MYFTCNVFFFCLLSYCNDQVFHYIRYLVRVTLRNCWVYDEYLWAPDARCLATFELFGFISDVSEVDTDKIKVTADKIKAGTDETKVEPDKMEVEPGQIRVDPDSRRNQPDAIRDEPDVNAYSSMVVRDF